mmetsp:Transcript_25286/g.45887  ORF Transcript_25286/g.45887 Transcript_25286/m.45887 type:complete len:202 (+) Transcript_25286:1342-1947(+)
MMSLKTAKPERRARRWRNGSSETPASPRNSADNTLNSTKWSSGPAKRRWQATPRVSCTFWRRCARSLKSWRALTAAGTSSSGGGSAAEEGSMTWPLTGRVTRWGTSPSPPSSSSSPPPPRSAAAAAAAGPPLPLFSAAATASKESSTMEIPATLMAPAWIRGFFLPSLASKTNSPPSVLTGRLRLRSFSLFSLGSCLGPRS